MADVQTQTAGAQPSPTASAADRVELLLGRCAQRDERALKELYGLASAQLLGLLMRMLKRRAVAEEALQDVMVQIWQRADQYVAYRGRAMTWMMAIARYRAIDLLRAQRTTAALEDAPPEALADVQAADFALATTSERLSNSLRNCLGLLSDDQRRCLTLAYVDGYSQDQIASTVKSPLGTVKSWMRRGLASLKRCLDA